MVLGSCLFEALHWACGAPCHEEADLDGAGLVQHVGLGFRGFGFRVLCLGFRGSGFRGLGFRV